MPVLGESFVFGNAIGENVERIISVFEESIAALSGDVVVNQPSTPIRIEGLIRWLEPVTEVWPLFFFHILGAVLTALPRHVRIEVTAQLRTATPGVGPGSALRPDQQGWWTPGGGGPQNRGVRLVRAVVLSVREEPYVEAAIAAGTKLPLILTRHILPNTIAPMIVQATYICASAMLTEAILGFLGAGIPPEIPSWGNIMAEGRTYFQITPWIIFYPGIALAVTVLAVNTLGDGLRDTLDPRIARKM